MPSRQQAPDRSGYRTVFRVREFRAVFAAHLLSLLGVVTAEISLTVLVYGLTGSPLLGALTFALGFLPYAVGGTLLSSVADRHPARRVLVLCDLVCAACALLMALPGTPVAVLLVLRCALAAVAPVFTGTRAAALTDILGEGELYVLGRSLLRIVSQSAMFAGFGAGGLLLAFVSPRGAICLTVLTFLASALLLRYGTRARPARAAAGPTGATADSLAAARVLLADPRVRVLMLLFWLPALFVVAPEALAAPYADALGTGPAAVGLMMSAMAAGHVGAELYAGSRLSPRVRDRIVLPLAAFGLVPLAGYALLPGLGWALLLLVLSGVSAAGLIGLDRWFVEAVPEELRGRAMTLMTAGLMTAQGVGMALAGLAAEFWPVHHVVAGAGVLGTACCAVTVVRARRRGVGPGGPARTEARDGADHDVTSR